MLHLSDSVTTGQPVLVVRLSPMAGEAMQYRDALADHGLAVIDCASPEAARELMPETCRVGLLLITKESDLALLDRCERLLCNGRISWVGLVSEALIGKVRVREFIADHLFNFITLPAELDDIVLTLRHAWGMAFMRELQHAPLPQVAAQDCGLLGTSAQMQQLRNQIQKVASTDAPVLISGPAGSGKETTALAIHRLSARGNAPFVSINCMAAPQLLEATLFGLGGRLEDAEGGTLFLDAVHEMPAEVQARLLQLLHEAPGTPTGSRQGRANVRIMAASTTDLAAAVRAGQFREELYYRLNVMSLCTPRLNECGQDVEALSLHYFNRFASLHNRSLRGFSKAAMIALLAHAWPGNVRELINRIQRATVMAEGRFLQPEDLGLERVHGLTQSLSLEDARAAAERVMIKRALAQSRNQIARAATLLGVSRVTLYRLIEKYNIRPEAAAHSRKSATSMHHLNREIGN